MAAFGRSVLKQNEPSEQCSFEEIQEGTRKVVSPAAVNLVRSSVAMAAVGYEYASPTHPLSRVIEQIVTATEVRFSLGHSSR